MTANTFEIGQRFILEGEYKLDNSRLVMNPLCRIIKKDIESRADVRNVVVKIAGVKKPIFVPADMYYILGQIAVL
jgi:hypothetical protein